MSESTENIHTLDGLARPLADLRISLTDRCNFRCVYCMPESSGPYQFLKRKELLSFEELIRVSKACVELGVGKIRLTGGEPLLRRDLSEFIALLSEIEGIQDLAMTTNGFLLAEAASGLKSAGLHRVTVSLDSVDPSMYQTLNGSKGNLKRVLNAIDKSLAAGLGVKINCVMMRNINQSSLHEMVRHFLDFPISLRFIEYMDAGNRNGWNLSEVMTAQEMRKTLGECVNLLPKRARYFGEVAQYFQVEGKPLAVGFIQSVSKPFCGSCTRLRLTAKGELFTCLFAQKGADIRSLLKSGASDEIVRAYIASIWESRQDRYSEIRRKEGDGMGSGDVAPKVEMYQIGG